MTHRDRPWESPHLDVEERVGLLLEAMTLPELVGQLNQTANLDAIADEDLLLAGGVGSSLFASGATAGNVADAGLTVSGLDACRAAARRSRLGVPLLLARDVIHGHRTVVPIPLGLAASFDPELVRECAVLAAAEAAAAGIDWTFAPMIDIAEDPRWGRMAESLGESAVLTGRLGASTVAGFQSTGCFAACAKHFVGYALTRGGRDYAAASVGENTLRNLHLRPFRDAVGAGCRTVMTAFVDVDGIPMHAHRHLLRDVLKGEWGFDGLVVADWNGIGELVEHGVAEDLRDAARQAIEAGVDVDMVSGAYAAHLVPLVEDGVVDRSLVVDAARRVLRLKFRLGLFDVAQARSRPQLDRGLARRAAAASLVLVSNDRVLPLADGTSRVHLTGPFVDDGASLLGTWVLDGAAADVVTPATAFRAALGDRLVVTDGRFSDLATARSRDADLTIALVGEHPHRSGEDSSVAEPRLPAGQLEALREIASVGGPLVVVVFTGRALVLHEVLALADAVIVAWHPGIEAGPALADLILGRADPVGRLPVTFPRAGTAPLTSNERATGRPIAASADRRRGRYLDSLTAAELPFGSGLAYTTFAYGRVRADADELVRGGAAVVVSVDVTNTGRRAGREIVQLRVGDPVAEVTRPIAELADWVALELEPGETGTARFRVDAEMFGYHGRDNRWRVDAGAVDVTVGAPHPESSTLRLHVR